MPWLWTWSLKKTSCVCTILGVAFSSWAVICRQEEGFEERGESGKGLMCFEVLFCMRGC